MTLKKCNAALFLIGELASEEVSHISYEDDIMLVLSFQIVTTS